MGPSELAPRPFKSEKDDRLRVLKELQGTKHPAHGTDPVDPLVVRKDAHAGVLQVSSRISANAAVLASA